MTTSWLYHQGLCLKAWHINSAHAPLNDVDGGLLILVGVRLANFAMVINSSLFFLLFSLQI